MRSKNRFPLRPANEIEGAEVMLALFGAQALVTDDPGEQLRGFPAARPPNNLASRGHVALLTSNPQPGVQKCVPLPIGPNAQRFQIPPVATVVLGEIGRAHV